jgi:RNA polymerase sigma factor (sigma-70 family)
LSTSRLYELNDPLLRPVIDAPDERAREAAIEVLLVEHARPLIAAILQRFRRSEPDLQIEDLEEISSLVAIKLIRKVRAAAAYEEHAVKGLGDYLATLTYNALYDFRRRRYPERHRLKRNLRYLLSRDARFALWETPDSIVAGLARWKGQPPKPATLTRFSATAAMRDKARPAEAVYAILAGVGHPVTFESLVDLVAELWQVRDIVIESGDDPARAPEAGQDVQPDQLSSLEQREYLATLWSEIRTLPDHQRAALLLNLRDAGGNNALTLFLLLNVATVAELARGAGLSEEELNAIWEQLPLDDLAIAKRLGLTRQQIINLRKSARTRLARRMAKWK